MPDNSSTALIPRIESYPAEKGLASHRL
jgi:hypothetical protein